MENHTAATEHVRIEAEITASANQVLTDMADRYHLSIGEIIDRMVCLYAPSRDALREEIRTQLADVLDSDQYRLL